MEKKVRRIGVLTSGGDAPGMNAAVRAVVRTAVNHGVDCVGIRRGWSGLINSDFLPMNATSVSHIINKGGVPALTQLGEDFNNLMAFLPELMIGGDCMKALIETVKPHMQAGDSAFKGKIVIGCAKGDLHDIGKSLVATQLAVNGFDVVDLGTDVSTNKFLDTADACGADIIAISSLLTTSQYYMEELIKRLASEGRRDAYKVAIGGGPINPDYAEKIGADGYSRTADLAVKMADRLMAAEAGSALISEV